MQFLGVDVWNGHGEENAPNTAPIHAELRSPEMVPPLSVWLASFRGIRPERKGWFRELTTSKIETLSGIDVTTLSLGLLNHDSSLYIE